jgi:hypothetical protein
VRKTIACKKNSKEAIVTEKDKSRADQQERSLEGGQRLHHVSF